jgi:protein-disulfide isomerase-like protein with CxxC motif
MSQTTRAHRLTLKAWQLGGMKLQQAFAKRLFKAHFEDGAIISDVEMLSDVAEAAGVMTKDSVSRSRHITLHICADDPVVLLLFQSCITAQPPGPRLP